MVSKVEKKVRKTLIKVARGELNTYYFRKITYKELWLTQYPGGAWGQGHTPEVVEWIVNISNADTDNGLPPLNALVVRKDTSEPGKDWKSWHKSVGSPFESQDHAQAACWAYWPTANIVQMYHRSAKSTI
ncbi:hypothetical protein BIT28_20165 [Photobacterium proteolyticum]|uniref:Uncharacterized protein n=1 Tax=Photobacterium proteolyticum TaxID=1903952 RepID=A0A1Q9H7D9_9GAMM|nr:hypothetical protein [Photobacterium proteolyticum]OLQ83784.1 hypothetical protein BIT28_20165 [Photobacterium proteolyticum]